MIELKRTSMILKQEILKDDKKIFDCNVRLALLNSFGKLEKLTPDMKISNIFMSFSPYFLHFRKSSQIVKTFILHYSKHDLDLI